MRVSSKERLESLLCLPLGIGALLAVFVLLLLPGCALVALAFIVSGTLCTSALFIVFPLAPLKSSGPHHVGLRHISPKLAVYYPTFIRPIEGEPWLPGNDLRYIAHMAAQNGMRSLWLKHLKFVRIPCTRNATVVSLMTHHGEPRQVFVFSHTLGSHHLAYSHLAMALAASGALVYSVLHSDNIDRFSENKDALLLGTGEEILSRQRHIPEFSPAQLTQRVGDVVRVIEGISRGEFVQQLQPRSSEVQAFLSSGPKVNLIGHGLGALTVLTVAMRSATVWPLVNSVTALDAWSPGPAESTARRPPCLRVQLVDSEEWSERRAQSAGAVQLKEQLASAGLSCADGSYKGTDHVTVTDMGLLTPLANRRRFVSKKSSKFIPLLAKDIMRFSGGREEIGTLTLV